LPRFRSFLVHSSSTSPLLIGPCCVFDDVIGSRAALSLSVFGSLFSAARSPSPLFLTLYVHVRLVFVMPVGDKWIKELLLKTFSVSADLGKRCHSRTTCTDRPHHTCSTHQWAALRGYGLNPEFLRNQSINDTTYAIHRRCAVVAQRHARIVPPVTALPVDHLVVPGFARGALLA